MKHHPNLKQKLKNEREQKIKEKNKEMNNKTQELKNINQKNEKEILLSNNNSMEIESSEEEDIINKKNDKNNNYNKIKLHQKSFELSSNKSEMTQIYNRKNELRKLELHFGKEKNKYILEQNEFNSIYYNYKHRIKNQEIEKKNL